jgi:ketol-acid reductoisomerase
MNDDQLNGPVQDQQTDGAEPDLMSQLNADAEMEFVTETSSSSARGTGLLLAGLLLAGAAAIYFMHLRAGPGPAAASAEVASAKKTITEFLSDGGSNLRNMQDLIRNTEQVVQQFSEFPSQNQVALDELQTNPFLFVREVKVPEDPAKILAAQREQDRAAAKKAAEALRLQSIMTGNVNTCMINNKLVTEGQECEGFLVEKITASSVIVKRDGFRFELSMRR